MDTQIHQHEGLSKLAEFVRDNSRPQVVNLTRGEGDDAESAALVAFPNSVQIKDAKEFFDKWLPAPRRHTGTSKHKTIASFIAHVLMFKDEGSAIFANADPANPQVLSIYDYNFGCKTAPGTPRFGEHRAELSLELSDEWKIWTGAANEPMNQADFAEFIEANIADIQPMPDLKDDANAVLREVSMTLGYPFAGQPDMMRLSKGIAINESTRAKAQVNLQTGERAICFESQLANEQGDKLDVPGLFLIAIPVFKDAHIYRLPVRLRFRVAGGGVVWSFDIYRDDKAFKVAYDEACATIAKETGISMYVGAPEGR